HQPLIVLTFLHLFVTLYKLINQLFSMTLTCFFLVVLKMNNIKPKMTIVPPKNCDHVTISSRMKYAKTVAPTGSNNIPIVIVEALTHFKAQLNKVCPKKVGIIAKAKK